MEAVLLAVAVAGGAYWCSVWRRPFRPCRRCGGSKGNTDTNKWKGTFGRCYSCEGVPEGSESYWDENCACCDAECGEADDQNVCLICGH